MKQEKQLKITLIITALLLAFAGNCLAQKSFTPDETKYYTTAKSLLKYFEHKKYDSTHRAAVFEKFVYFDYILADTSKAKIKERIKFFDAFFPRVFHFVDSLGIENLDAKPTRLFKTDTAYFSHFSKKGELKELIGFTLTYYHKKAPQVPLGTLLFEPKTHKLMAWTVIDQGGYWYFLTFNLF